MRFAESAASSGDQGSHCTRQEPLNPEEISNDALLQTRDIEPELYGVRPLPGWLLLFGFYVFIKINTRITNQTNTFERFLCRVSSAAAMSRSRRRRAPPPPPPRARVKPSPAQLQKAPSVVAFGAFGASASDSRGWIFDCGATCPLRCFAPCSASSTSSSTCARKSTPIA